MWGEMGEIGEMCVSEAVLLLVVCPGVVLSNIYVCVLTVSGVYKTAQHTRVKSQRVSHTTVPLTNTLDP